jgi:hypothetical protein
MEFAVQQQPAGSYRLDSTFTCQSPLQYYGPPGCGPANGPVLALESLTTNLTWNNPLVLRISGARPQALTLLFFGLQDSGTWRGIPLPFDGGLIGATGCALSTSILWAPRRAADARGEALFGYNVPPILRLQNTTVSVQAAAEDGFANPLGVVTSQAARMTFCGFERVARVFANGLQTTVGVRELGVAPIVRVGAH